MRVWETLLQQHISEHIFEQTEDVPVPQITVPVPLQEETDEVIQLFPAERTSERTVEQIVDMPVPQILEEVVEVVKAVSAVHIVFQERLSERICEQIVDTPVPHAVDEPVLQFRGGTLEVIQPIPAERISECIIEGVTSPPHPGAHLGAYTDHQCASTADFGRARRTRSPVSGRNC